MDEDTNTHHGDDPQKDKPKRPRPRQGFPLPDEALATLAALKDQLDHQS